MNVWPFINCIRYSLGMTLGRSLSTTRGGFLTALLIAFAMMACSDDPVSTGLDDATINVPSSSGDQARETYEDLLKRLERESELGFDLPQTPGDKSEYALDQDPNVMIQLALESAPDSTRVPEPAGALKAANEVAATLDIPEVCGGTPALDFPSGRIHFEGDCDALLAAKDQLRGTVALNWDTSVAMTEWEGVVLGGLGVERLYLHFRGLDGLIPPELGALGELEVLSLGRNELTGEIPPELGSMRSLRRLYLQDNQLTGELPPELGSARRLERVYMWNNQLAGEIPPELGFLILLDRLALFGNQLTGEIPPEIGRLTRLRSLPLQDNLLTGSIPTELGRLSNLVFISLSRNRLTGNIPQELGRLRELTHLYLYDNQLTGPIPTPGTGAWEDLAVLNLRINQLTGEVPAELGKTNLSYLSVRSNSGLTGPLPLELQTLVELSSFYWYETGLCSPDDPSFQAWLASFSEEQYRGGEICGSEGGGGGGGGGGGAQTYRQGETVATLPTGIWTPDVTLRATFSQVFGVATITFDDDGYIEEASIRYTCRASGGCRIVNRVVQQGTIEATSGGGGNRSPETVGSIADRTMTAGDTYTVDASSYFRDPDGDQLTYTATSSSTGAATVSVSGSSVTITAVAQGSTSIRITATDPGGLTARQSFSVTVEDGGGGGARTYGVGETITTLPTGFWNPDLTSGATFIYSGGQARITFNNGGYIEEASIRYTCRASGGCRIVDRVVQQGTIEATGGGGGGGGGGGNRPPGTAGSIADRTMTAGDTYTVDASSYFNDPDGDQLTYTASSSSTSAATVSVSGSSVTVTAVAQGSATIRITATDPGGLTARQSFSVTVEDGGGGGTRTYGVGETIATLPTGFWNPDVTSGATFIYSGGQARITFNNGGYIEEASIRYTCRASGGCRIVDRVVQQGTIEATGGGGGGGGGNRSPGTVSSIADRTMTAGDTYTVDASSYFNDPDGDQLTYTASSSSTSAATVSVSGSSVTVTAVAQGSATIRITATDPGGLTARQSFSVTVEDGGGDVPWLEGQITRCAGAQEGLLVRVTIEGNVRANRDLIDVRLEGTGNGQFVGVALLGSMQRGQSKSFRISGLIALATTVRCGVTWTATGETKEEQGEVVHAGTQVRTQGLPNDG